MEGEEEEDEKRDKDIGGEGKGSRGKRGRKEADCGNTRERDGIIEWKIKEIEKRLERKKKEERRKNIVIKEIKVKERKRREDVKEIMKDIIMKVKIEEIRRIKGNEGRRTEMLWIRLENEEQRKEILEREKNLRDRKERIVHDLMWKNRKMRWKLEDIARIEERRGTRVLAQQILGLMNNGGSEMRMKC